MRLFDLFMRRAGVQNVPVRSPSSLSRLTVVCPRDSLASVRRQIYKDFQAAGLSIARLHVDHAEAADLASACVTVNCPPDKRAVLMSQARQLSTRPGVHKVRWGHHRHIALN